MADRRQYFLCGIGGSGMLPLALILKARGHVVEGSDRALDQGRTGAKFDYLRAQGVGLFPQDGSGVRSAEQILVTSAAVEETVPDVVAANRLGLRRMTRAQLLAGLFNASPTRIGVAGTSGKSTTTAMIAWILHETGRRPTVMNGAVMKNFSGSDAPFASALVGDGDVFVSEVDESDGSIALYDPTVGVLTNVSLDHKSMDELRALFADFLGRSQTAVINLDDAETAAIASRRPTASSPRHRDRPEAGPAPRRTPGLSRRSKTEGEHVVRMDARDKPAHDGEGDAQIRTTGDQAGVAFGIDAQNARFSARMIEPLPLGVSFGVVDRASGETAPVRLRTPGRHNVANALAAIAACSACGVSLADAAEALSRFAGVKRRLEPVGEARGVAVIDDFAHNPDKIAASLKTLHEFAGRLLVYFQPHGYGPLRKMKDELIAAFADNLGMDDLLLISEPAYFGGTVERTVTGADIAAGVAARGRNAQLAASREEGAEALLKDARPGDAVVVMGARDDTLSDFAREILDRLRRN